MPKEIAMPEILLFTKPGCQKCDYVKARIPDGLTVEVVDTSEAKGLAEKLALPVGDAREVDEAWGVLSQVLYGPEITWEIVEDAFKAVKKK